MRPARACACAGTGGCRSPRRCSTRWPSTWCSSSRNCSWSCPRHSPPACDRRCSTTTTCGKANIPLASLFQGTGAVATFLLGSVCLLRCCRRAWGVPSPTRLFLLWIAYCGVFMALPQVVVGALSSGSDVGMAMDYFQLGADCESHRRAVGAGRHSAVRTVSSRGTAGPAPIRRNWSRTSARAAVSFSRWRRLPALAGDRVDPAVPRAARMAGSGVPAAGGFRGRHAPGSRPAHGACRMRGRMVHGSYRSPGRWEPSSCSCWCSSSYCVQASVSTERFVQAQRRR